MSERPSPGPDPATAPEESRLAVWEGRTDLPLTAVSLLYLVLYAVQVLALDEDGTAWRVLDVLLWVIWVMFVADYVGRLALARRRWRFVLRHPLDLLVALAPFLRFLRLLRLVAAVSTLARVLRDDFRGRVGSYLVVSVSLVSFVAALAVYEAERDTPDATIRTFGGALWWVLATITTVGYGDRYPITVEGRLVAAGLMLAGIAILGTVTAAIATWFLEQVGASDPAEAVHAPPGADRLPEGRDVTGVRPREARDDGGDPSEIQELLVEIRALRVRLERLEGTPGAGGPGP